LEVEGVLGLAFHANRYVGEGSGVPGWFCSSLLEAESMSLTVFV
jgi:hypothetical protein